MTTTDALTLKHRTRLEFIKGSSKKFYEVSVYERPDPQENCVLQKHWGRIGTAGQIQNMDLDYTDSYFTYGKLVGEKIKKGYKVIFIEDNTEPEDSPANISTPNKRKPAERKKEAEAWADDIWDVL